MNRSVLGPGDDQLVRVRTAGTGLRTRADLIPADLLGARLDRGRVGTDACGLPPATVMAELFQRAHTPSVPKRPLGPPAAREGWLALPYSASASDNHRDVGDRRSSTAPLPGFRAGSTDFCGLAAPAWAGVF
jgi:hypothetical protein